MLKRLAFLGLLVAIAATYSWAQLPRARLSGGSDGPPGPQGPQGDNGGGWYTGGDIDFYVDGQTGNDSNDCLAKATPCATIKGVYKKNIGDLIPGDEGVASRVRVWIGGSHDGGVGNGFDAPTGVQTYFSTAIFLGQGVEGLSNQWSYRGPKMVPFTPATGQQRMTVVSTTELSDYATQINFADAGWTANDLSPKFARFLKPDAGNVKVIFEMPIAKNDNSTIRLDYGKDPDNSKLADKIQAGDIFEVVRPAVKLQGGPNSAPNFAGMALVGKGSWVTTDLDGTHPGGYGGHSLEKIEINGALYSTNAWLSTDRCWMSGGDTNFSGGAWQPVNTAVTSTGILIQNGSGNTHDQAGPRPDSASDPIFQLITSPAIDMIVRHSSIKIGTGGLASGGLSGSYTPERNISIYDSPSNGAIEVSYGGKFIVRFTGEGPYKIALQGDDNANYALWIKYGGFVRIKTGQGLIAGDNANKAILLGSFLGVSWATYDATYHDNMVDTDSLSRITGLSY